MPQKRAAFIPAGSTPMVEKLINFLMLDGKKLLARRIFRDTLTQIEKKEKERKAMDVVESAVRNVSPLVEVKPKRIGGGVYQIPVEVSPTRQLTLALRWIVAAARDRKGRPMSQRLAEELLEASAESGSAFKKKENIKQMAKANRAFAHMARF